MFAWEYYPATGVCKSITEMYINISCSDSVTVTVVKHAHTLIS